MPRFSYPYSRHPIKPNEAHPQGTVACRPLLLATIVAANNQSLRFMMMPDSGADSCLFPISVAIMLNLDVLSLPAALSGGVGGQANLTYYDRVTIDLGNGLSFPAYAGFSTAIEHVGWGLLGQAGFFEHFKVEFNYKDGLFWVEPN